MKTAWLLACILAAALAPGQGLENAGLGPLEIGPLGPSLVFRETPVFLFSPPQRPGGLRFNAASNWLNYWILHTVSDRPYTPDQNFDAFPFQYGSFLIDMEVFSLTPRIEWQATRRLRLDADIPVYIIGGGILDGLIEGFHKTFSIDNHHRDWRPRNGVEIFYIRRDGTRMILEGDDLEGGQWGNAVAGATLALWEGRTASSARLAVKAPTASLDFFQSNGWDATLQWTWAWCSGTLCGYHGAGWTHHGAGGDGQMALRMNRLSLLSALEMRLSPRTSMVVQAVWVSPYAEYPAINQPVFEMTLGMKKRMRHGLLEIGFIENLFFYDNSPDIGIHLAWTWPAP